LVGTTLAPSTARVPRKKFHARDLDQSARRGIASVD
jgi:hypothetical protein